jgi:hypothetical protein
MRLYRQVAIREIVGLVIAGFSTNLRDFLESQAESFWYWSLADRDLNAARV